MATKKMPIGQFIQGIGAAFERKDGYIIEEGIEYVSSLTDVIRADFNYTEVYQEKIEKKY